MKEVKIYHVVMKSCFFTPIWKPICATAFSTTPIEFLGFLQQNKCIFCSPMIIYCNWKSPKKEKRNFQCILPTIVAAVAAESAVLMFPMHALFNKVLCNCQNNGNVHCWLKQIITIKVNIRMKKKISEKIISYKCIHL